VNLLAIDTAAAVLSLALGTEQGDWYFEADAGLRHSELAMDGVAMLVRQAGLCPADLSGVACMGGPGSFTGLRIGFSIAKGLALSLGIPLLPVPTLDCMAYSFAVWPGLVVPVIGAGKTHFFYALYRDGIRRGPQMDAAPADIARIIGEALSAETERGPSNRGGYPVLLAGPGAEQLCSRLAEPLREPLTEPYSRDLPAGMFRTVPGPCGGYGRALLAVSRRDIEKKAGIFNNSDMDCFSGPEYIRKSDAELQYGGTVSHAVETA
jgi:tRNA threonylcarbamoyladenosine biosynthesis protein TsaB